jgi:hypothetical protein
MVGVISGFAIVRKYDILTPVWDYSSNPPQFDNLAGGRAQI